MPGDAPAVSRSRDGAAPRPRFTLDGDAGLELRLARTCAAAAAGLQRLVSPGHLEALLLGGGYGRGEGGVDRTADGDRPYNDMEFWVFLRGPVWRNERRYLAKLSALAHRLSADAGLEVEFKITDLARWRYGPVTMFSYDLVQGHRVVLGDPGVLRECGHHGRGADIPLAEATRLLLNRCTGLLFAAQRLRAAAPTAADLDFVARNLAKAQLALGDAVLAAHGQYHWSCRERARRLADLAPAERLSWLPSVRHEHREGVAFKLHPQPPRAPAAALAEKHRQLALLAAAVWLWLERRRLGVVCGSPVEYALHPADKCPETSALRNCLVNMRRFGVRSALESTLLRYPRERLLRALPVLLWQPAALALAPVRQRLQRDLRTRASDHDGLVAAYTSLWEVFR